MIQPRHCARPLRPLFVAGPGHLTAARGLGLAISEAILLRADEVIE
jgi:hypothetical protein